MKPMQPYEVGILGATGLVGQRLISLLDGHPWFRIAALAASERSAGRPYRDAVNWRVNEDPPEAVRDMEVRVCRASELTDCDLVLSGLDASVARTVELDCAEAGHAVISNSSAYRYEADVPLLVPEINSEHLSLVDEQRKKRPGFIVTNPNCSTIGLALVLHPLHRAFGVRRLVVSTLQAVSGAGAEGPRALDMLDNVIPYIPGEEEKIEKELAKILGQIKGVEIQPFDAQVSAHCHRVGTLDGHLESLSVEFDHPATPAEVVRALEQYSGEAQRLNLPSAPRKPILVRTEPDRPQPRLDRRAGGGMSAVVGRVRPCPVLGTKLELLSHNTIRGAAGGTLLNAELLAATERLPRRGKA